MVLFYQKGPRTKCISLTAKCFASAVAQYHALSICRVLVDSNQLLSIYSFILSTCPAHNVTNFIDFGWFRQLFRALLLLKYSSLDDYNSESRKDIKKQYTGIFLISTGLSNSAIKKPFHLHLKVMSTHGQICSDLFVIRSTVVRIHSVYMGLVQNWNGTMPYEFTFISGPIGAR